jgi:hypothetical protein
LAWDVSGDATSAWVQSRASAKICITTAPSSPSLTRLALCTYAIMAALAQDCELSGDTNDSCGQRKRARERLEPLFVHCNVIVPAFGLLV